MNHTNLVSKLTDVPSPEGPSPSGLPSKLELDILTFLRFIRFLKWSNVFVSSRNTSSANRRFLRPSEPPSSNSMGNPIALEVSSTCLRGDKE